MTAGDRPDRGHARRRQVAIGVAASVLAIGVGVHTIDAAWSTSVTPDVDLTVVTPAIPEPQSRNCVTQSSGLGGLNKHAHFTWTAPAGGAVPTGYVIRVQNGATTDVIFGPSTATSADITLSLLQGLSGLSWLLTLLLGGPTASAPVTIKAVYGDYESPNNWTHQLNGVSLPNVGVACSTFTGGSGLAAPSGGELSSSVDTTTTIVSSTTTTTTSPPATTVPATTMPATTVPATTTSTVPPTLPTTTTVPPTTSTVPAPTTTVPAATTTTSTTATSTTTSSTTTTTTVA